MHDSESTIIELINQLGGDETMRAHARAGLLALAEQFDVAPFLIDTMAMDEGRRAYSAADILGVLGDERAIGPLAAAVSSRNSLVGSGAVRALRQFPRLDVIPMLVEALSTARLMVQQAIILALQDMDDQRAVAALLAVLHTTEEPVLRTAVIKALIKLGDRSVVEVVRLYVNDSDHHVRDWANEAVARLGGA